MTSFVHLKDEHCPGDSHMFSQFVRTPLGKPYDMKVCILLLNMRQETHYSRVIEGVKAYL